ncbi:RRP15-like protein [Leptotrombidium deliense]|uniref:RRP15-like protein n=1 Tax=Leptotrombidium deliense TaxID=299467 RepID=A0A443SS95_9ACAR|nr:RRP15-like protein [Leptotrombidium deliense]
MSAQVVNPFADCVNKILNSNKSSKKCILLKALKDKDVEQRKLKKTSVEKIEFVDSEGNVKNDESHSSDESEPNVSTFQKTDDISVKRKSGKLDSDVRTKKRPEINDHERKLNALATKGVIHLFNTVLQQQQTIEEKLNKAGPSETKKDKVLSQFTKSKFLDKLKKNEKKESNSEGWKVLKDDFLGNANMKDWDNEEENSDHDI